MRADVDAGFHPRYYALSSPDAAKQRSGDGTSLPELEAFVGSELRYATKARAKSTDATYAQRWRAFSAGARPTRSVSCWRLTLASCLGKRASHELDATMLDVYGSVLVFAHFDALAAGRFGGPAGME